MNGGEHDRVNGDGGGTLSRSLAVGSVTVNPID